MMNITMITGRSSKKRLNNNTKNRITSSNMIIAIIQALIPVMKNIAFKIS